MKIRVSADVAAPLERVWQAWTTPAEITQWNFASADWICPRAEMDLRVDGRFSYRMEARDGSMGFDFCGRINALAPMQRIEYAFEDGRHVDVGFDQQATTVTVWQLFDADSSHPEEQQRAGWQSILDNFKTYVESQAS